MPPKQVARVILRGRESLCTCRIAQDETEIDGSDTDFQAFARLSLANDSDLLLERLICVLPRTVHQPWHSMEDWWGVNKWDILPKCQISGVGNNNTVIINGAHGAAVRWQSFAAVADATSPTWKRVFA